MITCRSLLIEAADALSAPPVAAPPAETGETHLFTLGNVRLHSGELADWKIERDALTDQDYDALARMLAQRLPAFGAVEGVPRGGLRLMEALAPYANKDSSPLLIVDDVLTTGGSLEAHRDGRPAIGAVLFARGACPPWVTPLFQMPSAPPVAAPPAETGKLEVVLRNVGEIAKLQATNPYLAHEYYRDALRRIGNLVEGCSLPASPAARRPTTIETPEAEKS